MTRLATRQTARRRGRAAAPKLLVFPGHAGWDDARRAWNLAVDQRPAAVALPESADDVVAAVDHAGALGLQVAVQGTGHGAGSTSLDGTLLINTVRMIGVDVDPAARVARVAAGALWTHVVEAAADYGLTALHGSAGDVGVVQPRDVPLPDDALRRDERRAGVDERRAAVGVCERERHRAVG